MAGVDGQRGWRNPGAGAARAMAWCATCVWLVLAGCAHYHARPLTPEAVNAALAVHPMTTLWVRRAHLLLPSLPPLVVHKGERLTPDLAAVVAVVGDPALRALRAQEAVARAQVLAAGLLPNPVFSYGVGVPFSGTDLTRAFRVGLGLPIESWVTRTRRVKAALRHARAVNLATAWQEWQVAARAKALTYALIMGRAERRLLSREIRALRQSVAILADGEVAGYVTLGVAGAARLALRQTEVVSLKVRQRLASLGLQLRALLGVRARAPLRLARHMAHAAPGRGCLHSAPWLQGLTRRRLDLRALREGYASQDAALRAAIAGQFPAITVGVDSARDTSDINTLGAGIAVTLPIFNHNQGAIAEARATRRALFRDYTAHLFAARVGIHRLITRLRYLRREMRRTQSAVHALAHLEALYHAALVKHRIAALTYYQLLEQLVRQRLVLLRDRALRDQLAVAVEAASGRFEWPKACVLRP